MKQRIRLTEGDLRRMIRQCVNEAFTWYGSKIDDSLNQIISACNYIYQEYNSTMDEEDPWVTDGEVEVYKWAKKVRQEAEELLMRKV